MFCSQSCQPKRGPPERIYPPMPGLHRGPSESSCRCNHWPVRVRTTRRVVPITCGMGGRVRRVAGGCSGHTHGSLRAPTAGRFPPWPQTDQATAEREPHLGAGVPTRPMFLKGRNPICSNWEGEADACHTISPCPAYTGGPPDHPAGAPIGWRVAPVAAGMGGLADGDRQMFGPHTRKPSRRHRRPVSPYGPRPIRRPPSVSRIERRTCSPPMFLLSRTPLF